MGTYLDISYQPKLSGLFKEKIFFILHAEHDESRTGRGNFASLAIQANRLKLTEKLHIDASLAAIFGDGERFEGHNFCVMPSAALHLALNPTTTLFLS